MPTEILSVPPLEAIEHFRAKGYHIGFDWRDSMAAHHVGSFTVAKAMRLDILEDIRGAVDEAIAEGLTLRQFQQRLEPTLRRKGWWGQREMVDPVTGERRLVQLGSPRRLRTIFGTNIRMATAHGRWQRVQRLKEHMPYMRYVAVLDARTRPEHARWHGIVLPVDHPFWRTHFPPNGWHCRCIAVQLSDDDLARYGYSVSPDPDTTARPWTNRRTGETIQVPLGIDPGFGHNVGLISPIEHANRILGGKIFGAPPDLAAAAAGPRATGASVRQAVERSMRDDPRIAEAIGQAAASADRADRAMAELQAFARRVGVRTAWSKIDDAALHGSPRRFRDRGDDLGVEAWTLRENYVSARAALRGANSAVAGEVGALVRAELQSAGVEFGEAPAVVGAHGPTARAVADAVAKHWPARMVRAASDRGPLGVLRSKARAHYDAERERLRSDGIDERTMVHEYGHHLQDRLVDVDADLRRLFWAAVRGERRRTINYRRLETQGGAASGPRAEAGYKDDLPDLYGGRTYLGRSGRLGEAAESPDELFAMLAQSLLRGDRWTLDWFRLQPAMVDAFLDAMLRETWASRRHIMLDRWRST